MAGTGETSAVRYVTRFRAGGADGRPVGGGVLLHGTTILTCAHVVNAALDRDQFDPRIPDEEVCFDLPALPESGPLRARVIPDCWLPPDQRRPQDAALLRLERPLLDPMDTPPLRRHVRPDQEFRCHGFPGGREDPVLAVGTIQGAMGPGFGWYQLVSPTTTGYQVERGFSGSPVWSTATGAVVGIVVTGEGERGVRVGGMLPLNGLTTLPPVADALAESLLFDPVSYEAHWEPAVRGSRLAAASAQWYFTGRHAVLTELSAWLRDVRGPLATDAPSAGCVVTGPPGSGKSAVLARVATASSSAYRARYPEAWQHADAETLPPVGSVQLALHARDKSLTEVCAAVAEAAGCDDERPERLVPRLVQRDTPFTLLLDGLDEARDGGRDIAQGLLQPLAAYGDPHRLRLLVGARPQLLEALGPEFRRLHLDDPAYAEPADLEAYTRARLAALGPEDEVAALAARVAERAYPLFLVAQLAADALQSAGTPPNGQPHLPTTVPQALELYLLRSFTADDARRIRDLLRPLALAQGEGLPPDALWARIAGRMSGRDYRTSDINWMLDRAPALLAASSGRDGVRYGLFHLAFAESLGAADPHLADAFLDALLESVPARADRTLDWSAAPAYVRRHLAHHAEQAGRLAELHSEPGYLAVADPEDVLRAQNLSGHALGRDVSHLMTALNRLALPDAPGERAPLVAMRLMQRGRGALAGAVLRAVPAARWRPLWFSGPGQQDREADADAAAGHQGTVRTLVQANTDGPARLASGGDDGRIVLWDAEASRPVPLARVDAHIGGVTALDFVTGPDDMPLLISGGADGAVRFWDVENLELLDEIRHLHDGPVTAVCVAGKAEAEILVSGGVDGAVCMYDGHVVARMRAHVGGVVAVRPGLIGPENRPVCVSLGREGTLRVLDVEEAEEIISVENPNSGNSTALDLLTDADGLVALSATDAGAMAEHAITATSAETRVLSRFKTRLDKAPMTAARLVNGPDGATYRACAMGADLLMENRADDEEWTHIRGVQGISALAGVTAADGKHHLALGGDNGTLRLWPLGRRASGLGDAFDPVDGFPSLSDERGTRPDSVTAVAAAMTDEGPVVITARGGAGRYRWESHIRGQRITGSQYRTDSRQRPRVEVRRLGDGAPAAPARSLDAGDILTLAATFDARRRLRIGAASSDMYCHVWVTGADTPRKRSLMSRLPNGWSFAMLAFTTRGVLHGRVGVAALTSGGKLWFLPLGARVPRRKRAVPKKDRAEVLALGRIGERSVVVTWSPEEASALHLRDLRRRRPLRRIQLRDSGRVTALALSGSLLVAGGADGSVALFHLDQEANVLAESVHATHGGSVSVLCSLRTASGLVTVSGGYDGQVHLWSHTPGAGYLESIALGTPVLSACEATEGVLLVGTDLGAMALRIGTDLPPPALEAHTG